MTTKQMGAPHDQGAAFTAIETGWLYACYAHGLMPPVWLHLTLAHIQQEAGAGRLPAIILPATEQQNSLVVMTLHEFLRWSHQRTVRSNQISYESHVCTGRSYHELSRDLD